MATRKRSGKRGSRNRKKKDSPLWQWVLVAVIAFALYQGLNYFLNRDTRTPQKTAAKSQKAEKQTPTKTPGEALSTSVKEPLEAFSTAKLEKLLPEKAYPDNFNTTTIHEKEDALLAYAKTIPGKKAGPQGLTNTQPGLRYVYWDGKKTDTQEISFKKLEASLGGLKNKNLEGLPRIGKQPFNEGNVKIYPTRIFLNDDNREVMAYLQTKKGKTDWAVLHHPSGKKMPAAFVLGTTKNTSRNVRHRKHGGRNYLIVENGILDDLKPYEGYQWTVQAYYWDEGQFTFDQSFSTKLTEAKQKKSN